MSLSRSRMMDFTCAAVFALVCAPSVSTAQRLYERPSAIRMSAPRADRITAFIDVSVVPMDEEKTLSHQTVLIQGGRILALGPVGQTDVPSDAVRIDGRGKFLLPGLADMHAHVMQNTHIANGQDFGLPMDTPIADSAEADARLFLWLANGVTTVRNMDYAYEEMGGQALRLRTRAASGQAWLPHIYTSGLWGPLHYIGYPQTGKEPAPVLDSIASYIAAYKAAGYDHIKVHNESPVILDSVLVVAKRIGIPVVGHVSPPSRVEHVLPLGYKSIEHPFTDYLWNQRQAVPAEDTAGIGVLAAALRNAHVWHCPTQQHYDRLHPHVGPPTLKVEQDSGVKLLLGTDEGPRLGVITRELQAMVSAGLTPYQALMTGTRNVAEYFGTADHTGTIAVGKQADLVLLTGNPLQDVRYTAQPVGVMVAGRWLPQEEIERQVTRLHLPTFEYDGLTDSIASNAPVKSYWRNVVDEFNGNAMKVFRSVDFAVSQEDTLLTLRGAQSAHLRALADSLGHSDQYTASMQRIVALIDQQLEEFRAVLTAAQYASFDPRAKEWIQRRTAEGYTAAIRGVQ